MKLTAMLAKPWKRFPLGHSVFLESSNSIVPSKCYLRQCQVTVLDVTIRAVKALRIVLLG